MKLSQTDLNYLGNCVAREIQRVVNLPEQEGYTAELRTLLSRCRNSTPDKPRQRKVSEKARQEHNVNALQRAAQDGATVHFSPRLGGDAT